MSINSSRAIHQLLNGRTLASPRGFVLNYPKTLCKASVGSLQYTNFVNMSSLHCIYISCLRADISVDK